MLVGIGIDCVQISRMEKSLKNEQFLQRVYSEQEQQMLAAASGAKLHSTAAANFAAKEAFLKAAGVGLGSFALSSIAVLRATSGQPYYLLSGKAQEYCEQNGITAHLSITHEAGLAMATAILEQQNAQGNRI